jgi:hypothetical protein
LVFRHGFLPHFPNCAARCDNHRDRAIPQQQTLCPEENIAMKRFLVCTGLLFVAATLSAQQNPPKSPPATEAATIAGKTITITYNSPGVKGRAGHIFTKDGLIGKDSTYPVWRAGANTATKLQTEVDLKIGSLAVPKGDYSLYVDISNPDHWVLIINKQTGQWGTKYDKTQDLGRVKMTMSKPLALVENLKYTLSDLGGTTGKLTLEWENHSASVLLAVH